MKDEPSVTEQIATLSEMMSIYPGDPDGSIAAEIAALAQSKPGEVGEPVAWKWRPYGSTWFLTDDKAVAAHRRMQSMEVVPLYTADALSASHARVEALQAERDDDRLMFSRNAAKANTRAEAFKTERDALQAEVDRLTKELARSRAWASGWHHLAETICTILDLGALEFEEIVPAVRAKFEAAEARLASVEKEAAGLRSLLVRFVEAGEDGILLDCKDNHGRFYQSQFLADTMSSALSELARASLHAGEPAAHD